MHSTSHAFLSHDQDMLAYSIKSSSQLMTGVEYLNRKFFSGCSYNFKHIPYILLMIAHVLDFHVMLTWPVVGRGSKCTVRQFIVPRPP